MHRGIGVDKGYRPIWSRLQAATRRVMDYPLNILVMVNASPSLGTGVSEHHSERVVGHNRTLSVGLERLCG
jgi:hypothetical protein